MEFHSELGFKASGQKNRPKGSIGRFSVAAERDCTRPWVIVNEAGRSKGNWQGPVNALIENYANNGRGREGLAVHPPVRVEFRMGPKSEPKRALHFRPVESQSRKTCK